MVKSKKTETSITSNKKVSQKHFIQFETRDHKVLYIRPRDIPAVGAHVLDGTQTRIFVKDVIEQLVVEDTAENIIDKIVEFEKE